MRKQKTIPPNSTSTSNHRQIFDTVENCTLELSWLLASHKSCSFSVSKMGKLIGRLFFSDVLFLEIVPKMSDISVRFASEQECSELISHLSGKNTVFLTPPFDEMGYHPKQCYIVIEGNCGKTFIWSRYISFDWAENIADTLSGEIAFAGRPLWKGADPISDM